MGNTLLSLLVKLGIDAGDFDKGIDDAEKKAGKLQSGLAKVGGAVVLGGIAAVGAGVAAMGATLFESVQAASEAADIQAQLESVLISTGGAAGVTADMVTDLADAFGATTKFEDDAIVAGENMLLTFTNISKDVFPLTTQTMLDMSQAMGTDLKSSAIMLGKALNDPEQGLSALSRVGVTFTAEQEKMIKAMVKAGDVTGAQTVMLNELQREFGGSAEAAGSTFAGQLVIAQNAIGNVKEAIGMALMPTLLAFATRLNDFVSSNQFQAWLDVVIAGVTKFASAVVTYLPMIVGWFQMAFGWLMENQGVIVGALAAIGVAVGVYLYTSIAAAVPVLITFVTAAWPVIAVMAAVGLAAYLLYEAWTNNWGGIQEKAAAAWAMIQPVLQSLYNWLLVNIPIAIQAVVTFWNTVLFPALQVVWAWMLEVLFPLLQTWWDWLAVNVPAAITTLVMFWIGTLWPALQNVWAWVQTNLIPLFKALANLLSVTLSVASTALAGVWQNVLFPALEKVWNFIATSLKPVLDELWSFLSGPFWEALRKVADMFADGLRVAMENIVGVIDRVTDAIERMADALRGTKLPGWMTPGSPTPWEIGLLGVADAMSKLNHTSLPQLEANLNMGTPSGVLGIEGGAGGNTTNNYNIFSKEQPGQINNALTISALMGGAA